ncbi:hypothetical protein ACIRL0_36580 [Streptomyces sp. NPDC102365]|uniref:hypothetical protein n=1 Tax=Streptomyces sp. NPDC102365 TaxID=3366162 RepID=UPI0038234B58
MDVVVCHAHLVGAGDDGADAVDGPDFGEVHERVVSELEGEAEALALLDELGRYDLFSAWFCSSWRMIRAVSVSD